MPQQSKRFGSETPRVWTPELRPLDESTSLGFECIQFTEDVLDVQLIPWQRWFLIHALELSPSQVAADGSPLFRFRKVVLLVGRQNGKSTVMQALTLWRMFVDRANLVIGTAQDLEVAESLLKESYELAEEVDELSSELQPLIRGAGKMSFRLKTGETYKVKAASRRGGRGLSGELVLLDELREHQSWDAWAAVTKTTNAKERAQIYAVSNAGDASSVVLRHLRKRAHAKLGDPDGINVDETVADTLPDEADPDELDLTDDDSLGIFEWSAVPGCSISNLDGLAQSNPALGHRNGVLLSTLASDAANDPEWIFRTEVMCQWSDGSIEGPFPPGSWDGGRDEESKVSPESAVALCVDVSWDRSTAYVGLAGLRPDGKTHVEVIAQRAGTDWVAGWLTDPERSERVRDATVAVQSSGAPASSLIDVLTDAGVSVVEWKGTDLGRATGAFYDLVRKGGLRHRPQPSLDVAAATATAKPLGDAFVWDRKHSPADASPLVAVTGAAWFVSRVKSYELLESVW